MEPRITDTLPRESDACREENKSRVRVDTSRKEDIEKWINSSRNHSDPKVDLWRHLEKIPSPKFAGNKMKYEEWKARFKVCVDSTDAPTIYKLVQLRSLLRGEAEELLEGLGWEAVDYESAWKILEDQYGGDKRFIKHQFKIMRDLRPVRTTEEFLKFARRLNSCIITLENKEHFEDLGAGMLYSVVKTKLPDRVLERYYGWLENRYRPASLKSLSEWAMLQAKYTSAAEEDVKGIIHTELKKEENNVKFRPRRRSNTRLFATTVKNHQNSGKSKCIKCSKDHELTKCSEFQKASLRSCWRLAQSKQLCFKCSREGHRSEDCKQGNACQEPDCDNNFHHLLHYNQKKISSVTDKKTKIQKREEEHPTVEKSKEKEDSNYVKKSASHRIALRTAPVILVNGNKRIKAIAFLDDGSTGTFI